MPTPFAPVPVVHSYLITVGARVIRYISHCLRPMNDVPVWNTGHALKRKCRHFDEIFITGCTRSCQMTTSGAANDENFIKMTTFPFKCDCQGHIPPFEYNIRPSTFPACCLNPQYRVCISRDIIGGLDKMADILLTTFFKCIFLCKIFCFLIIIAWRFVSDDPVYNKSPLVPLVPWCGICAEPLP